METNQTIFRAKSRWASAGEKPSAYFLGLEKRRSKNTTITALRNASCRILTSNRDILERQRSYFAEIIEESPDSVDPIEDLPLSREDIPSISDLDKMFLDCPFTEGELQNALKSLNKGKTPASDGLTPEFYVQF